MSDGNPYSPPLSNDPPVRPKRTHIGPILSGLIAIFLLTIVSRGTLLPLAVFEVGWWWFYKFWPRKTAAEDVGARTFLDRLEHSPTIEDDALKAVGGVSPEQPLDGLKDLRL